MKYLCPVCKQTLPQPLSISAHLHWSVVVSDQSDEVIVQGKDGYGNLRYQKRLSMDTDKSDLD